MLGRRRAGVLVPLFSVPSTRSWGIGELPDLAPLARWLRAAGQSLVQVLPLNEMVPGQRSPYSTLSAMALDPIFIGLDALADWAALGGEAALDAGSRAVLGRVRASPRVDYGAVEGLKRRALRAAFEHFREAEWRRETARGQAFEAYRRAEAWWLDDYALFRALHARFEGRPWPSWPDGLAAREAAPLDRARQELSDEILFRQYLQWVAEEQWRRAREEAHPVAVVGDLAFGVGTDSADVWAHREAFDLGLSVGTPPDDFNPEGQDWGLPAYRWEALGRDGYGWLGQRARRSAALYDAYRVDHVVGFYRTYVRHEPGGAGRFLPAEEPEQLALGEAVLSVFQAAGAPIVAEDLGTVPDFVRASLSRLGIPGYRVLRWEREWKVEGQPFRDPAAYPPLSIATSGTHDTTTMAEWWETMPPDERAALLQIPALQALREEAGGADRARDALVRVLLGSGSDSVLLPIQDVFGWRDRVNVPGTVGESNWTYRLPWPADRLGDEPLARDRAAALARSSGEVGRS